jgi:hypothetical protein
MTDMSRMIARRLVAGFPEYTTRDWDTRPDWMRTEPWCTKYAVDAVMSGFARDDGYRARHRRNMRGSTRR